jgi:putative IMPACT (imprinted ancient) family translation regulator
MPQTLRAPVSSELIIKKSRFIGCVQPMTDRSSAQAVVDALWREHPGAAHVCWALLAGGQSAAVDDGEPSGTAGRPMLDVLRHQDLEGVLATVVRYFGGVKLGAGGLVRAYTDAVAQALLQAEKVAIQRMQTLQCTAPIRWKVWCGAWPTRQARNCWRSITALWCASSCRCPRPMPPSSSVPSMKTVRAALAGSSRTSCRSQKNPPLAGF